MLISHVLLWIVAIAQAVAIVSIIRQSSVARDYLETGRYIRYPVGSTVSDISCVDLPTGRSIGLSDLRGNTRLFLVFLSSECSTCKRLLLDAAQEIPQEDRSGVVFYCAGSLRGWEPLLAQEVIPLTVLGPGEHDASHHYGITTFPAGVEIDDDGTIAGYFYPSSAADLRQHIEVRRQRRRLALAA